MPGWYQLGRSTDATVSPTPKELLTVDAAVCCPPLVLLTSRAVAHCRVNVPAAGYCASVRATKPAESGAAVPDGMISVTRASIWQSTWNCTPGSGMNAGRSITARL